MHVSGFGRWVCLDCRAYGFDLRIFGFGFTAWASFQGCSKTFVYFYVASSQHRVYSVVFLACENVSESSWFTFSCITSEREPNCPKSEFYCANARQRKLHEGRGG